MSKVTYKKTKNDGIKTYICIDGSIEFGKISKYGDRWYFVQRADMQCSDPKVFRAIAKKLEKLNEVKNDRIES